MSGPFLRDGDRVVNMKKFFMELTRQKGTHTHIQKLIHDIKEKKKNSQVALVVKNPPAMQETQEMGSDPRVGKIPLRRKWQSTPLPAWRISWTQGPGRLPTGLLRVTHD